MNKMKTPRHIEIGGISFCGSTVFNLILGSLPNVTAVGESHWLVDSINDSNEKSIQKSSNEEYEENCPNLSNLFKNISQFSPQ